MATCINSLPIQVWCKNTRSHDSNRALISLQSSNDGNNNIYVLMAGYDLYYCYLLNSLKTAGMYRSLCIFVFYFYVLFKKGRN